MGNTRSDDVALDVLEDDSHGFSDSGVTLGDLMRGERATMGKSLLDVEQELKIKATYIAAIENADIEAFETRGFIPGYVRSYARYLNMDQEKAFAVFCKESGYSAKSGMESRKVSSKTASPAKKALKQDVLFKTDTPFLPEEEGFLTRLEPAALGSTVILLTLIAIIGYGAWSVLNEIQRVNVVPTDNVPEVLADLDPVTGRDTVISDTVENIGTDTAGTSETEVTERMDRLYRPQALDVPVLISRDAPIATLDPSSVGTLPDYVSTATAVPDNSVALQNSATIYPRLGTEQQPPVTVGTHSVIQETTPQVLSATPLAVKLVAVRPAWIRVKAADGTTLFEGIMNAGQTFDVPETEEPAIMKVGESGAVYFAMGDMLYGPAGQSGSVTSDLVLSAANLQEKYNRANVIDDQDLSRYVAELNQPVAEPSVGEPVATQQ